MPDPTSHDDALLARLNALKKSSVSFDTSLSNSIAPPISNTTPATNAHEDLAARFARLGSASPSSSPKPSRNTSAHDTQKEGAPIIAPGAPSYLEGIAEGVGSGGTDLDVEGEKSLEELLGELGPREEWDLSKGDEKNVGKLLTDIKAMLPEVQKSMKEDGAQIRPPPNAKEVQKQEDLTDWESVEVDIGSGSVRVETEEQHEEEGEGREGERKKTENEEADDVIARVMAELEISKKYGPPSPTSDDDGRSDSGGEKDVSKEETQNISDSGGLTLPSAPTSVPQDDFARTQALEDALTARLAALSRPQSDSLGLPSAPSFSPAKKPPKVQSSIAQAIDDEIDTWCIICNDDATLKCLGCDGDLYCQNCWMEGHRGESAGFEERRHKAVLYSKDKRKKQAAA